MMVVRLRDQGVYRCMSKLKHQYEIWHIQVSTSPC